MTFSIVGRDKDALGVGVASGSIAVRDRVPWVREGIGAIATQGYTEVRYGSRGLDLLEEGLSPRSALERLTREDPTPERRQVAIMDSRGRTAVYSGSSCPEEVSSASEENCVSIGNMLKDGRTTSEMVRAFRGAGDLPVRILKALESGERSGGDRRGTRTAALVTRGDEDVDIAVDSSKSPLRELRERYGGRSG